MLERIKEISELIWVKIIASIPLCFFILENKEYEMLYGFMVVIILDTFLGSILAFKQGKFDWGLLGKKLAKKFVLYFTALLMAFIIARLYESLSFTFYFLGSIFLLSEAGSGFKKLQKFGLKLPVQYLDMINGEVQIMIKNFISGKRKK